MGLLPHSGDCLCLIAFGWGAKERVLGSTNWRDHGVAVIPSGALDPNTPTALNACWFEATTKPSSLTSTSPRSNNPRPSVGSIQRIPKAQPDCGR
jgi:hypothetical protein